MDECKQYNSNTDQMYSLGLESVIDKSMKDGETNLRLWLIGPVSLLYDHPSQTLITAL